MKLLHLAGAAALALAGSLTCLESTAEAAPTNCQLGVDASIKHVIFLQFDNVHYVRDNPNVPSDLEQMPNLLNFLTSQGALLTNHHTPLISHTSVDILTALTG